MGCGPPVSGKTLMIPAKVLGRKHSKRLSRPDLWATFSEVRLVKTEFKGQFHGSTQVKAVTGQGPGLKAPFSDVCLVKIVSRLDACASCDIEAANSIFINQSDSSTSVLARLVKNNQFVSKLSCSLFFFSLREN